MIRYVKVDKLNGRQPVSVRINAETTKPEYCFGSNVWRNSIQRAWADFQEAQQAKLSKRTSTNIRCRVL